MSPNNPFETSLLKTINKRRWTLVTVGFAMLAVTTLASSFAAAKKDATIAFPFDYKTTQTNYLSLDRTQNPDQVIRLFAPRGALEAAQDNKPLPHGTVLVAEIYKARKAADGKILKSALGRRIRGKFAAVAVMEKRRGFGATQPARLRNGDWDFAIFSPKGERLVKKDLNACRACHAPLAATDHLFSLEHMRL